MIYGIIALIVVALIIIILYYLIKNIFLFIINSIIGFFALFGFNYVFNADVQINFWSVLLTVVGGIIGFFIVLAAHFLGIAF